MGVIGDTEIDDGYAVAEVVGDEGNATMEELVGHPGEIAEVAAAIIVSDRVRTAVGRAIA
jgi:hypothetical protein